eukprot:CAMPEP_0119124748 /NCGR_PEP_ID=MMETSP1310-20130426/4279_1 /TAXON_ID=464262 /ORGANISM="Genus nov. species nov., Strain RCC2339" /LENGTH=416 /DNA_ID=CAMNT_0007114749 /DNA_START=119 /DNA_END=1372 /DNA_ORIENTATION=-
MDSEIWSESQKKQREVEVRCERIYSSKTYELESCKSEREREQVLHLYRDVHRSYLESSLEGLPQGYSSLDASRPWIVYWITGSLSLLDVSPAPSMMRRVAEFFGRCQDSRGGIGGGPGQLPHLAPTYAAVNAMASLADPVIMEVFDRSATYAFLLRMKHPSGGFRMHEDGEVDIRATYCALSVAKILHILSPALTYRTAEFFGSCQTYEGGFGGEPFNEAHGGYTFCGTAGCALLNDYTHVNTDSLLAWVAHRQMATEGGFQGRCNKLVDACYSFWQGACLPILAERLAERKGGAGEDGRGVQNGNGGCGADSGEGDDAARGTGGAGFWSPEDLQRYLLLCCQDDMTGGFRDKPPMRKDLYHTFYSLAGLSLAQGGGPTVYGGKKNALERLDPVHGVRGDRLRKTLNHFSALPSVS